ncbi:NAD(P) transhydrogenase subunit alpha [Oleiagrimonas sp. C23AA]|nr:NAD(P) transhydrogenase subunit alpha [Oleiagrimonas sp. C23AA]NII11203.1 NAD(P) transhydrogenase subunit alpha [Oleiagrimonas sp. C23AA]
MTTIAVLKETHPGERRVALVPSVIERLAQDGLSIRLQSGAGDGLALPDAAFAPAEAIADSATLLADADIVLAVQPPDPALIAQMRPGAILACLGASHDEALLGALRERGIICFAMEQVPRISRAQAMDVLTSQATLAGYYAVLLGATQLARILPRMTTAVGTLRPAQVLVMGLGVAGLQAIATAHRLGALVEGYDVRPETREQAASLGAKFVDTGVDARGEGGYARELTDEEKTKVAAAITRHIQQADLIVTTASVPGRAAPKLISRDQVQGMKAGAVIVDLAAESGGNCECSQPGQTVREGQVTVAAPLNVPSLVGEHASELYAKNLAHLLGLLINDDGAIAPDWSDEVLAKTAVTRADPSHATATLPG